MSLPWAHLHLILTTEVAVSGGAMHVWATHTSEWLGYEGHQSPYHGYRLSLD